MSAGIICSGTWTATTSPRAQILPPAVRVDSTITLRPLTSFTLPRISIGPAKWCGQQIIHVQRSSEEAQRWHRIHFAIFRAVFSGGGCARGVAVNERGNQTAIGVARDCRVVIPWFMDADGFLSFPITFNFQTMFVETATAVTVA